MGRWGDGELTGPLWGLGAVGRWGDGAMGRWGVGSSEQPTTNN
ncbi:MULTISPECIES: hypothetical protein [Fischerella]|nr:MULTISPECIES: hypothetical protein [Fischerella]